MSVSIKPWTWARVGQLFRMGFRMRWLSTCSSTSRIACSSAARGTEAHGLLRYLKIGRKRRAYGFHRAAVRYFTRWPGRLDGIDDSRSVYVDCSSCDMARSLYKKSTVIAG